MTPLPPRLRLWTVRAADDAPPLANYAGLGARDAMRVLRGLPLVTLERLYTFEDLHMRRTSVLRAIKRAIDRIRAGS